MTTNITTEISNSKKVYFDNSPENYMTKIESES